jgi:phage-related protein
MRTVIGLILLICVSLSLYAFIFHNGETLSFEEAYNNAFGFVVKVGGVFEDIRTNLEPVMEFYANGWTKIAETFETLATKVMDGVNVVIDFIKPAIESVRDFVKNILDGLPGWITN